MNILCTICARGGSKGVANKALKNIQGIPLIGARLLGTSEITGLRRVPKPPARTIIFMPVILIYSALKYLERYQAKI